MSEPKMISYKDGATGWLVFSNAERLNAVSFEMWQAIPECIANPDIMSAIFGVLQFPGNGIGSINTFAKRFPPRRINGIINLLKTSVNNSIAEPRVIKGRWFCWPCASSASAGTCCDS